MTYIGANVKHQVAARQLKKTGFEDPELVLPMMDQGAKTRCAVMRPKAEPLDRPLVNGTTEEKSSQERTKQKPLKMYTLKQLSIHLRQVIVVQTRP